MRTNNEVETYVRIENNKYKIERLNHYINICKVAQLIEYNNELFYAVDMNRYGICPPYTDYENSLICRDTLLELANDTFVDSEAPVDYTHYPNAPHGSIWDY